MSNCDGEKERVQVQKSVCTKEGEREREACVSECERRCVRAGAFEKEREREGDRDCVCICESYIHAYIHTYIQTYTHTYKYTPIQIYMNSTYTYICTHLHMQQQLRMACRPDAEAVGQDVGGGRRVCSNSRLVESDL